MGKQTANTRESSHGQSPLKPVSEPKTKGQHNTIHAKARRQVGFIFKQSIKKEKQREKGNRPVDEMNMA